MGVHLGVKYARVAAWTNQHVSEVEKDEARSDFLRKPGYEVLRVWDHKVFLETEVVLQRIADLLAARGTQ